MAINKDFFYTLLFIVLGCLYHTELLKMCFTYLIVIICYVTFLVTVAKFTLLFQLLMAITKNVFIQITLCSSRTSVS
jgi:hypothetical protein